MRPGDPDYGAYAQQVMEESRPGPPDPICEWCGEVIDEDAEDQRFCNPMCRKDGTTYEE